MGEAVDRLIALAQRVWIPPHPVPPHTREGKRVGAHTREGHYRTVNSLRDLTEIERKAIARGGREKPGSRFDPQPEVERRLARLKRERGLGRAKTTGDGSRDMHGVPIAEGAGVRAEDGSFWSVEGFTESGDLRVRSVGAAKTTRKTLRPRDVKVEFTPEEIQMNRQRKKPSGIPGQSGQGSLF